MSDTPSRRERILVALRDRLAAISTQNEFATDAGKTIFLGEVAALGPDDPPVAIAMVIQEDQVVAQVQGLKFLIHLPIEIQAIAKATLDEPWLAAEAVLADIKRAVELEDRTLGGLVTKTFDRGSTRVLEREEGSTTVGGGITYVFPHAEGWGQP